MLPTRIKPTDTQRLVLTLARDGKDLYEGCEGRSEHGGRATAIFSCRRHGWLKADALTPEGAVVLEIGA